MQFIIEHQAQFAVDIDLLREAQERFTANLEKLSESQAELRESQARLSESLAELKERQLGMLILQAKSENRLDRMEEVVRDLVRVTTQLMQAVERTDASVAALFESQARTDERLNSFIRTVERYITGGGNGKPPG
ncbi:MAG: hypothetical protein L0229_28675 [Blastocatellia bacterium]|nr:hypothetical protein [Blastocatellia bacterium]